MTDHDRGAFSDILRLVFELFNVDISEEIVEMWWLAMMPYGLDDFRGACNKFVKDPQAGRFAPRPAHIIGELLRDNAEHARTAWQAVLMGIKKVGGQGSVAFEDGRIVEAVKAIGGWRALCQSPERDLSFKQRDFEQAFHALAADKQFQRPAKICGAFERAQTGLVAMPERLVHINKHARIVSPGAFTCNQSLSAGITHQQGLR